MFGNGTGFSGGPDRWTLSQTFIGGPGQYSGRHGLRQCVEGTERREFAKIEFDANCGLQPSGPTGKRRIYLQPESSRRQFRRCPCAASAYIAPYYYYWAVHVREESPCPQCLLVGAQVRLRKGTASESKGLRWEIVVHVDCCL